MTIRLLGITITIKKTEKYTPVTIDQAKRAEDVREIVNTPRFAELKAQAQAARQARSMRG